ncbi:MAG: hypothetical protein AAGH99_07230 [Planctomycetota bacterium]
MSLSYHQIFARLTATALICAGGFVGWLLVVKNGADPAERIQDAAPRVVTPVIQASAAPALTDEEMLRLETISLQGRKAESRIPQQKNTPVTQARGIKLLGTLVPSNGPPEGLFIDDNDKLVVTRVGTELPGNIRVEAVSEGEATLLINGRRLQLQTERKRAERAAGGTR